LIESSIAGYTSVLVTSADQAFTALNGAPDEARHMTIALTTTTPANFAVYAPPAEKTYVIYNASSYTATIYNWDSSVYPGVLRPASGGTGLGVAIPAGKTMTVWSEGTNFRVQNDHLPSLTLTTPLAVAQGGTGVTTSTGTGSTVLSASPALTGTPTAPTRGLGDATMAIANTSFVQAAIERIHPIGSIYINATNSANPSTLFGFGTWVAFGAGLVPVGFNAGNPLFDAAEKMGGSANAITVSHTHTFSGTTSTRTLTGTITNQYTAGDTSGTTTGVFSQTNITVDGDGGEGRPGRNIAFDGTHDHTVSGTTDSTGSLATNANYQPFITVYMWKRTA
jgi:hypothetical protein